MAENSAKLTPMFEQYLRIKKEYPDALLFYRMGDFYELFFDDAVLAAKELQIALTSRSKDAENRVPMCGVPWHASQTYITQLLDKGFHVAVCDQVEDPREAKGLVKREVTRVITPGTVLDDANLEAGSHNFLAALHFDAENAVGGLAWADISTGKWSGVEVRRHEELWQWVLKLCPRELLLPETEKPPARTPLEHTHIVRISASFFDLKRGAARLFAAQGVREAEALGLHDKSELLRSCGALLAYLEQTQKCVVAHLLPFEPLDLGRHLQIDETTERNLEIFVTLGGSKGKGTLRHVLDATQTPMGGRLLEEMLHNPWREMEPIVRVQEAVAFFHDDDGMRSRIREALHPVYDLERLSTRITLNRSFPRDFIALRNTLSALPDIHATLTAAPNPPQCIQQITASWDCLDDCARLLNSSLVDSPPPVITDGGLFRYGYHADLDSLLDLVDHGQQKLQELLEKEQNNPGMGKLKMGYNRVIGHYYELSRAAVPATLPDRFIRRQTLLNAERFTTDELKKLENDLLTASERRKNLEYTLFQDLREHIAKQRERILHMADLIAQIDFWQSLAHVGRRNGWHRPCITNDLQLHIVDGRHPVVEAMMGRASFVPNSFHLEPGRSFCLLTGPNMAGKSTVLRQVAIISLLAQMGSMVPASEATLGLVDRLFSRVGASDNLAKGQSTFMVEMMETARILRQATKRSLVILDEIGRGTSTFDGVALAWAVVEYLVRRAHGSLRTVFATHYHELTTLEGRIPALFTMNIAIRESGDDILFLHKLLPGPSDRSYGVEVARLAGVPSPVVQRARSILSELERGRDAVHKSVMAVAMSLPGLEKNFPSADNRSAKEYAAKQDAHPVVRLLRELSPETLTPQEAIVILKDWKRRWGT